MTEKSLINFKARIKIGGAIFQDMTGARWPSCYAPGGGRAAEDPNMEFDISFNGRFFYCIAFGFGVLGGENGAYGSGSIFVYDMNDLIMDKKTAMKIIGIKLKLLDERRAKAASEYRGEIEEIDAAIAALN